MSSKVRYEIDPKDPNVPKKTKDLMLITYLFSTYQWCFSPDPASGPVQLNPFVT